MKKTIQPQIKELQERAQSFENAIKRDHPDPSFCEKEFRIINRLVAQLDPKVGIQNIRKIVGVTVFAFLVSQNGNVAVAQTFDGPKNAFNIPKGYYYSMIEIADLDGDGDLDVLIGEYYSLDEEYGTLKFYENIGTKEAPKFLVPQENPFGLDAIKSELTFPRLTDIDQDGDLDLFTIEEDAEAHFYKNVGDAQNPQFEKIDALPEGFDESEMTSLPDFADIDGDGAEDFISQNETGGLTVKYNSTKKDVFSFKKEKTIELEAQAIDSMYLCMQYVDFDNDGDLDMFYSDGYNFFFSENKGSAKKMKLSPLVNGKEMGLQPAYMITNFRMADIDNDGDYDLFYSVYEYGEIYFYENTGQ